MTLASNYKLSESEERAYNERMESLNEFVDSGNIDEDVQCIKCGWTGRESELYTLYEEEIEHCPECHEHEILYIDEVRTCDRCGFSGKTSEFGQDDGGAIIYCPKCNWII